MWKILALETSRRSGCCWKSLRGLGACGSEIKDGLRRRGVITTTKETLHIGWWCRSILHNLWYAEGAGLLQKPSEVSDRWFIPLIRMLEWLKTLIWYIRCSFVCLCSSISSSVRSVRMTSVQVSWVYEWVPGDLALDPTRLLVLWVIRVEDCLLEVGWHWGCADTEGDIADQMLWTRVKQGRGERAVCEEA